MRKLSLVLGSLFVAVGLLTLHNPEKIIPLTTNKTGAYVAQTLKKRKELLDKNDKTLTGRKAETYGKQAYKTAQEKGQTAKHILTIVDFTLPSSKKRLWVIDIKNNKILYSTYVAHGSNSGSGEYATNFSNKNESHQSSIGTYKTLGIVYGKHGKELQVQGLEYSNNNAYSRAILIHGADYIGNGRTGHTWGCFGIPTSVHSEIIDTIKDGTIIFAYYPDSYYLNHSSYITRK